MNENENAGASQESCVSLNEGDIKRPPCIRCNKRPRKEMKANNRIVHLDFDGNPVHAGYRPIKNCFSIFCEECIEAAHQRRRNRL